MKNLIYITVLVILFSQLLIAQETTVWLDGSKNDSTIQKQKAEIEAQGFSVFVNDKEERAKRFSAKEIASGDEKFDKTFRQARELMDNEEWAKAAAKFNEIVCDCPENKQVDAALYWLAYCYKKQKMFKETRQTIERLIKHFPNSEWTADARVLGYETYTVSGQGISTTGSNLAARPSIARSIGGGQNNLTIESELAFSLGSSAQTPLDREDEIKLAAFRSLIAADPKKGIEAIGNILRSDSKASETLKREVLRTMRGSRYNLFQGFGNAYSYELTPSELIKQLNPALRETLVKGFQTESNQKIRSEIIYSIANINDEPSFNYLGQLYSSEGDKEIKKVIINSFGSVNYLMAGTFYPVTVVNGSATATTATIAPSSGGTQTTTNTSQNTNPIRKLRFDKLMEIFRIEKDLELKRLAFSNVQRFAGWSNREGLVEMLSQMYDAETDEKFKSSIIQSFSNLKNNKQATDKLLNIAKNDKSDKMRLEAIYALGNSKDPEVIKFLESLIQ